MVFFIRALLSCIIATTFEAIITLISPHLLFAVSYLWTLEVVGRREQLACAIEVTIISFVALSTTTLPSLRQVCSVYCLSVITRLVSGYIFTWPFEVAFFTRLLTVFLGSHQRSPLVLRCVLQVSDTSSFFLDCGVRSKLICEVCEVCEVCLEEFVRVFDTTAASCLGGSRFSSFRAPIRFGSLHSSTTFRAGTLGSFGSILDVIDISTTFGHHLVNKAANLSLGQLFPSPY